MSDVGTVPAASRDPLGYFDAAELSGDSVHLTGWALDPDELQTPIDVHHSAGLTGLGCRTVDVRDAFGYFDGVTAAGGSLTAYGWAVNPNNPAERVEMHFYDTGPAGPRRSRGARRAVLT